MNSIINDEVASVFNAYPEPQKQFLLKLRQFIFETAKNLNFESEVTENLKWNQPSYVVKHGSPIRLGVFNESNVAIFFNCNNVLVKTFRTIYDGKLEFSDNRAIVLDPKRKIPTIELAMCIGMAFSYHKIKPSLKGKYDFK